MNLKRIASLLGLSILGTVGTAQIASADFSAVHKWTDSATNKTYVYIPGVTAGQPIANATTPRSPSLRTVTLNNCGIGKINKSATSAILNIEGNGGATVNFSGKTSGSAPDCTASGTMYSTTWSAPVGSVIEAPDAFYIKGGTSAGAMAVNVTLQGKITTKGNACGWVRLTVSDSRPLTTFTIGGTSYTLASLPTVTNPMICRKVGTASFTYVPAS